MKFSPALGRSLAAAALCANLPAWALVVDTGPGANQGGGASLFDNRPQQPAFQQLAAGFTVGEGSRIESVAAWLNWYVPGSLSFAIHTDTFGTPGAQLFATVAELEATGLGPDWRGTAGLNWWLEPGRYWLVFADVASDPASGAIPGGAALPLDGYAFSSDGSNGWVRDNPLSLGVRINAPIPEPSTTLLMAIGVIALLGRLRRR